MQYADDKAWSDTAVRHRAANSPGCEIRVAARKKRVFPTAGTGVAENRSPNLRPTHSNATTILPKFTKNVPHPWHFVNLSRGACGAWLDRATSYDQGRAPCSS